MANYLSAPEVSYFKSWPVLTASELSQKKLRLCLLFVYVPRADTIAAILGSAVRAQLTSIMIIVASI